MNHIRKIFIFIVVAFFFSYYLEVAHANLKEGQTLTYYYEMEKEVSNDGKLVPRSGEGQFYTITHNTCYESNKDGMDEGLGHLTYLKFHEEKRVYIFYGDCFYGKAAFYISEDYSRINVKPDSGNSYVLSRKTAPKSFIASNHKLIKQQQETILNGGGVYIPTTITTTETAPNKPSGSSIEYYDCPSCYGSGRCPICNGKGYYSNPYTGDYIRCTSCRNGNCSVCNGSGKKTRIKR